MYVIVPLCVTASNVYDAVNEPVASVKVCGEVVRTWPPKETVCRPSREVKPINPVFVVTGNEVLPACDPADSPGPREARRPPSNTNVAAPPGAGMVMTGVGSCRRACGALPPSLPIDDEADEDVWLSCPNSASGAALTGSESTVAL